MMLTAPNSVFSLPTPLDPNEVRAEFIKGPTTHCLKKSLALVSALSRPVRAGGA